mmetsp:Transcript_40059/g.78977  ORF Transcript_40059/g.78977 Transcript_40059/m.78977 type:complete len:92 (-) Transcript_40059:344-619(-)
MKAACRGAEGRTARHPCVRRVAGFAEETQRQEDLASLESLPVAVVPEIVDPAVRCAAALVDVAVKWLPAGGVALFVGPPSAVLLRAAPAAF